MQRGIQSASSGQYETGDEIWKTPSEIGDGSNAYDLRQHAGSGWRQEHPARLFDVNSADIAVIELECLRSASGDMIIKELAIINSKCCQSYLFKSPKNSCPDEQTNRFIHDNINGIQWFHGQIDHRRIWSILMMARRQFKQIFTKGLEKVRLLESYGLQNLVFDLQEMGAPKHGTINVPSVMCAFHLYASNLKSSANQCATEKAIRYFNWLCQQQQQQQNEQQSSETGSGEE